MESSSLSKRFHRSRYLQSSPPTNRFHPAATFDQQHGWNSSCYFAPRQKQRPNRRKGLQKNRLCRAGRRRTALKETQDLVSGHRQNQYRKDRHSRQISLLETRDTSRLS